ncbi:DNA/RNA non-specific endonuclease [Microbacterium sp.]|uniref:DNA/RNA non-specific endonuclease n=1 Tax=Microbacterium sp. TaxID=51671 RepID=UPI00260BC5C9|nr:DNA/RNA non-specific endonuclease [Microbacterium sp.]
MSDGYDADFLDAALPLPRPDRETRELPYPRFTVLLDTQRRFAAVTAVNIDGAHLRPVPRTGSWRLEDRVEPHEQAGNDIYRDNDLDRGHLVRRRDPGWGELDDARAATRATFFYPNAAPQASGFNQSKQLWLGLEDHVLAYAEASDQRVSVFTAPVLADDDPPYRAIQVPLRFWKVAAWRGPDGLAATGFILDQSDLVRTDEGLRTVAPLGAFRTFQAPIAEIAELAGVDFGVLPEVDVLGARTARAPSWRELNEPHDIIF